MAAAAPFLEVGEYMPPAWASGIKMVPKRRYNLAQLPTPVHRWHLPGLPPDVEVWVKRDDMTGMQLSGNKVRKLEFLLAEAKERGCDCVVTIGGIQSNHCRATAVAARYLGLPCHLILRMSRAEVNSDPGLVGNLLLDRMVGATIHKVTKEEYMETGSPGLLDQMEAALRVAGSKPFVVPVGGSNALGTWGYLQASEEIAAQGRQLVASTGGSTSADAPCFFTDVAMACGSGGTAAGLALGLKLAGCHARVHAYGVCDTPSYFYSFCDGLLDGLYEGGDHPRAEDLMRVVQARGMGYALSTNDEIATAQEVAAATGVVLDPVYSGKAVNALLTEIRADPAAWSGRRVLFVHTGGLLGMYDKCDQLLPMLQANGAAVQRMKLFA